MNIYKVGVYLHEKLFSNDRTHKSGFIINLRLHHVHISYPRMDATNSSVSTKPATTNPARSPLVIPLVPREYLSPCENRLQVGIEHTRHLKPQNDGKDSSEKNTQQRHDDNADSHRQATTECLATTKQVSITEGHTRAHGLESTEEFQVTRC